MTAVTTHTKAHTSRSPWQIAMAKLKRNHVAMWSLRILVTLYTLAIFAGFFSSYGYDKQHRDHSFHPPSLAHIHVRDTQGKWQWPFVYGIEIKDPFQKIYGEDTSKIYPLRFFFQKCRSCK